MKREIMKICAIICEYNPFHGGHAYQIAQAKEKSGADFIVCIMSGNFVQRGDAAILEKHVRARHAILAGADAVVELPTVFATSNAEIFAKGGVKIATELGADFLSFGVENGTEEDFLLMAKKLIEEPKEISQKIKEYLAAGESLAKARAQAWQGEIDEKFLLSPNNILGIEYAKAVLQSQAPIRLCPVQRTGGNHNQKNLKNGYASATAIREHLAIGKKSKIKRFVPPFVFKDLENKPKNGLILAERLALLSRSTEEIKRVLDCKEGLENALKKHAQTGNSDIIEELTSKRYTSSRIRRILLQILLCVDETLIRTALQEELYFNLLAVNKEKTELLSLLGKNGNLICRAGDKEKLDGTAKAVFEKDEYANHIYSAITSQSKTEKQIFI